MTEPRPLIISCDGHATGRPQDYVPYVEPAYRARYEESVRGLEKQKAARAKALAQDRSLFSKEGIFVTFDSNQGK